MQRRSFIHHSVAAAAGLGLGLGLPALAQGEGQLDLARIVTGFAAGGTSDTLCRRLAARMTGGYARSIVVENRTGAGGQIAIQAMKTLPPDGSWMLQTPMSMLGIYPHIYKQLKYDALKDVTPVSIACTFDFGFAVGPAVPASVKTVPQFLAWAKQTPTNAAFGSPAAGSVPHFIGVLLGRSAGVDMRHVPYRGTQPAILDMIGGQIPAVSGPVGDFLPHLAGGKCRILATSGSARTRFTPDTATLTEQGLKDMVFSEWFGIFLPPGAAPAIVDRLNAALRPALASSDVVDGLAAFGLEATASSPSELAARLRADHERWGGVVRSIGFTADS
ncbi:MAG: Bug family tripartite tricarboxylate transporter substrate binding protein [Pseudacidovorax sp.]|nr:Bug family tripartite tricarboxylate transporter substrate binding protein [Pseudacidovorax sp.]